jgi:hypothetical protein
MRKMFDRILVRYLSKRGWIVFWLDEPTRYCSAHIKAPDHVCWLSVYDDSQQRSE